MNTINVSHYSNTQTVSVPDPRVFDRNEDGAVDARDVLQNLPTHRIKVELPKDKEPELKEAEAVETKSEEKHIDVIA